MTRVARRRRAPIALIAVVLAGALGAPVGAQGVGFAQPAPPPPLSRLDELTGQLNQADARLDSLSGRIEARMERANKARADAEHAERDAQIAVLVARHDSDEARAANDRVQRQQDKIDRFASTTYQRGRAMSPFAAFAGSSSPRQALDRAEMLETVSATEGDILARLNQARAEQSGREQAARQAVEVVRTKRDSADRARGATQGAVDAAMAEQRNQQTQVSQLEGQRNAVQHELQLAQARANAEAARNAARQRAATEAQQRAVQAAQEKSAQAERQQTLAARKQTRAPAAPAPQAKPAPAPVSSEVEEVIQRALSQVGVGYAWGGGTGSGPTRGIRDGGVADAHGDYNKVGFDCSGLMVYAFSAAGIDLDHYSGYQADAGRQVPLAQARRGDLLFWQSDGSTHHVALYLGNGRMVEAPYSGSQVRVVPVRYGAGIAPYATRMF